MTGVGVTAGELPPIPDDAPAARVDPRAWFPDPVRPLEIEIGSGKGTFLLQQASRDRGTNYLGIEWAGEFFEYAADRCRRAGLENVRLLRADAGEFLKWRCADAVARVIHLYFPDPWPKTRHHKRRMVSDVFLAEARRVLQPGGELRVVTDHGGYWAWMEEHFARWCVPADAAGPRVASAATGSKSHPGEHGGGFERLAFETTPSARAGELVGTNFERKYRRQGRPFHAAVLRKPAPGA